MVKAKTARAWNLSSMWTATTRRSPQPLPHRTSLTSPSTPTPTRRETPPGPPLPNTTAMATATPYRSSPPRPRALRNRRPCTRSPSAASSERSTARSPPPPPVTALNTSGRSRLFCGICVCILPQRMPKAQREALRDAVCRRGGLADDAVSERTTHVVTLLTGREVVARFPSMKSSIFVVGPSFVNEAIRTGRTQTDLPTVESCVAASVTQKSLIKQRSIDEGEETEELVDEKGSLALVLKSHDDGEDGEKPSLMPLSPSSSPLTKAPSQPLWLVGQSTLPFKNAADISDGSDNSTDDSGATDTSDGVTSDDGGGGEVRLHSGHRRRRHVPALTRASVSAALYGDDEGGNVGTEAQEKSGETTEEEAEYVEKTPYGKKLRNQSSWACMRRAPTLLDDTNQNAHITSEFDRLVKRALADGDEWRVISYRKAINILKKLPARVQRVEDVEGIRGIGKQMRKKILEILRTGFVRKAHSIPENLEVLEMFQNVYGIGKKIARKLLAKGFRTLDDLRTWPKLTREMSLGLKYYDDFLQRIPRAECTAILRLVESVCASLDPDIEVTMMGSYRRGSETCGDVDFILTHTDGFHHVGILHKVLPALKKAGLIIDDLSSAGVANEDHPIYKGVCRLPSHIAIDESNTLPALPPASSSSSSTSVILHPLLSSSSSSSSSAMTLPTTATATTTMTAATRPARRIDILVVPYAELGAALIYFTGNEAFNRSLRHLADKKDLSLNQRGLFGGVVRNARGEKMTKGPAVAARTEQEIFDALGVPWRPPTERNI